MNKILPNILGLDIGARRIGVAVFENRRLVFYKIKNIASSGEESPLKTLESVLKKLVSDFEIKVIAVEEVVYLQQQRSFVNEVYEATKQFAEQRKIRLLEFEPLAIRQTVCQSKSGTKEKTFEIIATIFPELKKFLNSKKLWRISYYSFLFNAIAISLVSLNEIKGKTKR